MNVLVTGGYGFMGSHFIKRIANKHNVINVDKLTYAGNEKNLPDGICYNYKRLDIADREIEKIISRHNIDTIVNFAAETHVDRSIKDPLAFLNTDIIGLANLVHSSRERIKRFIHISTDEVYGPIKQNNLDIDGFETSEAREHWPLVPTSPYSASKASADLILQAYHKTYGFPVVIVRPCNNYGPNQYPEKLIPITISRLLQGKKALLHGEGREIREWIYVEDCVAMVETVMNKGEIGEIYNLGTGYRRTNLEIIQEIIYNMLGALHTNLYIDKIINRPGNDKRYAIDSSKIRELDNLPFTEFESGLEKTIDWYRENQDWYDNVNVDANIYKENTNYLR